MWHPCVNSDHPRADTADTHIQTSPPISRHPSIAAETTSQSNNPHHSRVASSFAALHARKMLVIATTAAAVATARMPARMHLSNHPKANRSHRQKRRVSLQWRRAYIFTRRQADVLLRQQPAFDTCRMTTRQPPIRPHNTIISTISIHPPEQRGGWETGVSLI